MKIHTRTALGAATAALWLSATCTRSKANP